MECNPNQRRAAPYTLYCRGRNAGCQVGSGVFKLSRACLTYWLRAEGLRSVGRVGNPSLSAGRRTLYPRLRRRACCKGDGILLRAPHMATVPYPPQLSAAQSPVTMPRPWCERPVEQGEAFLATLRSHRVRAESAGVWWSKVLSRNAVAPTQTRPPLRSRRRTRCYLVLRAGAGGIPPPFPAVSSLSDRRERRISPLHGDNKILSFAPLRTRLRMTRDRRGPKQSQRVIARARSA